MTIQRTSKPCIGGATPKRDRAELTTDGPSAGSHLRAAWILIVCHRLRASCMPDPQ